MRFIQLLQSERKGRGLRGGRCGPTRGLEITFTPAPPERHEDTARGARGTLARIGGEGGQCSQAEWPGSCQQRALREIDHVLRDVGDLKEPELPQAQCCDEMRVEDEERKERSREEASLHECHRSDQRPFRRRPSPEEEDGEGEERCGSVSLVEERGEADERARE